MTTTHATDAQPRLINSIEEAEKSSLEAVRKFLGAVDGAFPDFGDDGPRRRIIDSAFRMTEQLVGASNRLAQNVLDMTERELNESSGARK